MNEICIDNFISFCDEMQVAEEGSFKDLTIKIGDWGDAFITKALALLQRLILNLRKLKSYKVPNDLRLLIVKVRSSCDKMWFKIVSTGETEFSKLDETYHVEELKKSQEYYNLFFFNSEYTDDEYVDVPVNNVIKDIQNLNKTLTNTRILYKKAKRHDSVIYNAYWTNIVDILQISINALKKYFTYGKTSNSRGEVVDIGEEIEAEIIDY